eukprot:11179978-Lingulodinium_polyedra.AAC.1
MAPSSVARAVASFKASVRDSIEGASARARELGAVRGWEALLAADALIFADAGSSEDGPRGSCVAERL